MSDKPRLIQRAFPLKEQTLAAMRNEPELISAGEVKFLAHALVILSADPEDRSPRSRGGTETT